MIKRSRANAIVVSTKTSACILNFAFFRDVNPLFTQTSEDGYSTIIRVFWLRFSVRADIATRKPLESADKSQVNSCIPKSPTLHGPFANDAINADGREFASAGMSWDSVNDVGMQISSHTPMSADSEI